MKNYRISTRVLSLLLTVVMLVALLPSNGTRAASIDAEGYLGSVRLLNNGESISLPIKLNNFAMDGMMFEYLSSVYNNTRDSQYFLYETGGTYQLFSLHLAGKKVGIEIDGDLADKDGKIQPDTDAMSGSVDLTHSLTSPRGTASENYKGVTSGGAEYSATMAPYEMTDGSGAKYLQLRQTDRDAYAASGRTWRKLTRFTAPKTIAQSRYAVIIYRVNGDTHYDNMLLTWDSYDELSDKSNCSQLVPVSKNVSKTANSNWQYAIIDLAYNLGSDEESRAAAAASKKISDIYLKSPLNYFRDGYNTSHKYDGVTYPATGNSMDLAAVAYFPYYGDAEQFAHYGLTMGCNLKYYYRDNRGFDFTNATRTSGNNNSVSSAEQWDDAKTGDQLHKVNTTGAMTLQADGTTGDGIINTVDELSYALFGEMGGYATLGLLESQLDENGRPVYKEVVVDFVAMYLQNRLTGVAEYPSDNYGWKNYSYVTGVSTTSDIDEHLFGKDNLGHSIDLGTALCQRVTGAQKGSGTLSGTMGNYEDTRAKADQLIGTWSQCEGNIKTWFDAAYYLLHNLYVTDQDTAYDGDSYGEYEDDFQNLIMGQVDYKDGDEIVSAYAFDSGFCKNGDTTDSAVVYDRENRTLSINPAADTTGGRDPFLPSSGTGTEIGETNSPYYVDDYVIQHGRGYRQRDYLYTISGNGFFQFNDGLFFEFKGDDDVYLFINGQLVLDIGGTHSATLSKIKLDDYVNWAWAVKRGTILYKGMNYSQLPAADRARVDALALKKGDVYSFDFFYMERHGAGANLRIVTNIQVTGKGMNVDKTAFQDGIEIPENGTIDPEKSIEYAFRITNDSESNLYNLTFQDSTIGVSIDYINGLQISQELAANVRNASGNPLTAADLEILVSGKDAQGNDRNVVVTCASNDELKAFLADLDTDDGTVSGEGLWVGASIRIRGMYYTMTDAQKALGSFRNYVAVTADTKDFILRGADDHTVYQPGKLAYYQWVGKPVVIEREKLYNDLLRSVVAGAEDLPALGDMILMPSDADGVERQNDGLVNTSGGDVYLKVDYTAPGTYISYVTIRDQTNPAFRMTVPLTIYVTDTRDSTLVLDYGLDLDDDAILDYELNLPVGGNNTSTVVGIAKENITPSYVPYNTDSLNTAIGNTANNLTLLKGSYANQVFSGAQYEMDNEIYLEHNKPWVVEFKAKGMSGTNFLFSREEDDKAVDNEYLFLADGFIALGHTNGTTYYNYAVATTALKDNAWHEFKMYNVISGDGTNMVYLSIDGGAGAAMNNYYVGASNKNQTDNAWINGRDFTFKFLGASARPLSLSMEYLRVYEEGEHLAHYRWEASGNNYVCADTGKPGYEAVPAEYYTFTTGGTKVKRWRGINITLNSDRAWEIEFEMKLTTLTNNFMLLSSMGSKTTNKTKYIYIVPSKRYIAMGADVDGAYVNYGAILPDGFDMTVAHTYLLKNRINANGTNTVYLYADKDANGVWTEIGPLSYRSVDTSIETQGAGLSGQDFNFRYIGGHDKFAFIDQSVTYLEVHEDTALRTAYEWTAGTDQFASVSATSDGNRIDFDEEDSGIIEIDEGKFTLTDNQLKFEASDFMEREYSAYVAMTVHNKDYTPTPLSQASIDVAKEVQMFKKLLVLPANVVYYEDDFPAIHYMTGNQNVFEPVGTGTLDQVQSGDQEMEYGSDPFYQNDSSNMSGGHITKIAINEDDSALAWFEFKGTGFELISSTNAKDSAMIYLEIFKKEDVIIDGNTLTVIEDAVEGKDTPVRRAPLAWIPLTTEFDHGNDDGEEVIYQVPIIRWQQEGGNVLDPAEYAVIINGYATYDFKAGITPAPLLDTYLYIDGIRIFQPLGYANDNYADTENKAIFDEVRNQIMDEKAMVCEKSEAGVVINSGSVTWTENINGLDYTGQEFTGQKVDNVNDYLLKGPNNEVYMLHMDQAAGEENASTESSLAFVVYKDPAGQQDKTLGLQIAVRAIDAGDFFGTGSTGLNANLELGVMDANGTNSWAHLAAVTSGTEQYITIPYELCPVTVQNGILEYHVVIRVSAVTAGVPAMVSFSSIKRTEGLELKTGIGEKLDIEQDENGQWVIIEKNEPEAANLFMVRRALMAENVIALSEAVPGENFAEDTVVPENTPAILPQYPTLSFEGEVQYNIYYTVENLADISPENMGLITFDAENKNGTVEDAIDVIPGAVWKDAAYMVHTNGIPAKKLGDTLYFKVYAKLADGSYVYSNLYHYSAKQYARQQLTGSNDKVKPLVVAMLNYGAAAQQFFGYNTDNLMNADLTAEEQALVQDYHSGMASEIVPVDSDKIGMFAANGGFERIYPSVTFGGAFAINYYLKPAHTVDGEITLLFWDSESYESVETLTAQNALKSEKLTGVAETQEYMGTYAGIAAKEIGGTVYVAAVYESEGVTYCSGVLAYSLSEYCKGFAENSAFSEQNLAASTMVYGYYAEKYFAG